MKAIALIFTTIAFLFAAEIHPAQPGGLTVHEWGTFTSVADEDGSAVEWDALGGKDDLPAFVNDFGFRCFKFRLLGTVRIETPVLYFYSPRTLDAHVKVAFPQGVITEWYPRADYQIWQKSPRDGVVRRLEPNLSGIDISMKNLTGAIEWKNIKVQPDATPVLPMENNPSRYYAARATDSVPLTLGDQHEKFLFYRGVGRFPIPLSARLKGDGKTVVEKRGPDPVPSVILFENRGGRVGFRNVGAIQDPVTLDAPTLDGSPAQLRNELETALVAQGLYPREAQAMIETWKDSWFEEGSRLIYIFPSRALDAVLPIQVEPAPAAVARVFVGRIELITEAAKQTVKTAVANQDAATLARYDRFLGPVLTRIYPDMSPRLANEIEQLRQKGRQAIASGQCGTGR